MVGGVFTEQADGSLLVHSDDFPRYSLAYIFASELSEKEKEKRVIIRHPENGDILMLAGITQPGIVKQRA